MNKEMIASGVLVAIKIIGGIIGDIIPIPGASSTIDIGVEKIITVVSQQVLNNKTSHLFTYEISTKLNIDIENFDFVREEIEMLLNNVNLLDYKNITLESSLLKENNYNPEIIASKIIDSLEYSEKECRDIYKSLSYVVSMILVNLVKQDDFLIDILRKVNLNDIRITDIEDKLKNYDVGDVNWNNLKNLYDWNKFIRKYQHENLMFKQMFGNKILVSSLIPNIKVNDKQVNLFDFLEENVVNRKQVHIYARGVGGAGKTVTLINAWKKLLEKDISCIYIPLNRLDIENHGMRAIEDWIKKHIIVYENNNPDKEFDTKYEKFIYDIINASEGSFILLLDGVNELQNPEVLLKMLEQWLGYKSVSIIITSRSNHFFEIGNSKEYINCEFMKLSKDVVQDYLKINNIDISDESVFSKELLRMPHMLTLFVGTSFIRDKYKNTDGLDWHNNYCTYDIIHNYLECQIAEISYIKSICSSFESVLLINYILPAIAWEMHLKKMNYLYRKQINEIIRNCINEISNDQELPILLDSVYNPSVELTVRKTSFLLLKQLTLLEEYEKNQFYFVHQNFYGYLISRYWINSAINIIDLSRKNECWNDFVIPTSVFKCFTDTEGEICPSDFCIITQYWNTLRNKEIAQEDLCIFNLLRVYKQKYNWNLSSIDFSGLDLRNITLSGITLSNKNQNAKFNDTRISNKTFYPQGHHTAILQLFCLKDNLNKLYARDVHGNIGVYDLKTDKRLTTIVANKLGKYTNILFGISTEKEFLFPDTSNLHCEGIQKFDTSTKKYELIKGPTINDYYRRKALYVARVGRWLIEENNKLYLVKFDDLGVNDKKLLYEFNSKLSHSKWITNADISIALLQRNTEEKQQDFYKVNTQSWNIEKVYSEKTSFRDHSLSDDGNLLLIKDSEVLRIVDISSWKVLYELTPKNRKSKYWYLSMISDGYLSHNNQWVAILENASKSFPTYLRIYNLWNECIYHDYVFGEIISSLFFTYDNTKLIIGLFDGSIEEIDLITGINHRISIGFRVDQKLFNLNNHLLVTRSDGFYQLWDFINRKAISYHNAFHLYNQKYYSITSKGTWYLCSHDSIELFNIDSNIKKEVSLNIIYDPGSIYYYSNEVDGIILCLNCIYRGIQKIVKIECIQIDINHKETSLKIIEMKDPLLKNIIGNIEYVYYTRDKKHCVILWEQERSSRLSILIWSFDENKFVFNKIDVIPLEKFNDEEEIECHSYKTIIIFIIYNNVSRLIYKLDLKTMIIEKISIDLLGAVLISSKDLSEILVSIKRTKTPKIGIISNYNRNNTYFK